MQARASSPANQESSEVVDSSAHFAFRIEGIETAGQPFEIEAGEVNLVPVVGASFFAALVHVSDRHIVEHDHVGIRARMWPDGFAGGPRRTFVVAETHGEIV